RRALGRPEKGRAWSRAPGAEDEGDEPRPRPRVPGRGAQPRRHPGPQERALADPALGIQQRQPRRAEVRDDALALSIAAEEDPGVLLAEDIEADVRAVVGAHAHALCRGPGHELELELAEEVCHRPVDHVDPELLPDLLRDVAARGDRRPRARLESLLAPQALEEDPGVPLAGGIAEEEEVAVADLVEDLK